MRLSLLRIIIKEIKEINNKIKETKLNIIGKK